MAVAPRALKLPAGKLVERSPVLVPGQHAGARPPTLPEPRPTAQIQVAREGERQDGDHHRLPGHRAALQVQRLKAFGVRVAPARPGATRSFRASLDAATALERHRHALASAIADHAAAAIGSPIPATPPGLLIQGGIASHANYPPAVVPPGRLHRALPRRVCIPSAISRRHRNTGYAIGAID